MGKDKIGKNSPLRNIIGNRKKLENVWASNTSLTETAINNPRNVDTMLMRTTAGKTRYQVAPDKSTKKDAIIRGTSVFSIPKIIAPVVLASISNSNDIGARSNLSNDRLRLSKVMVTESIEVVPKRMEIVTTPGRTDKMLSQPLPDLMKNMPVHARGKIIPQLILGGLR
jgi:hypothetical protein